MFSFGQLGLPGGAQSVDPALVITGATTVEAGTSPTLTLSVVNNPATNPYDSFAEVADADGIASLSTATITLTTTNKGGAHSLTYKAVSSGGRPDIARVFTVTVVDTTAPVLSLPTDVKTGTTTADIGATTNEGSSPYGANGTLYVVASTSSTAPTAAQIIAGLMHTGATAAASGSVAVSSTGAKAVGVTGLTALTAYFGHSVQLDSQSNTSNIVTGDGFTTDALAGVTLNPADQSGLTLSNGNLTGTYASTTYAQARSTTSHSTGKYHFECTLNSFTAGGFPVIGLAPASHSFTLYCGQDVTSIGWATDNKIYTNGGSTESAFTIASGATLAIEVDLDAQIIRFQNFTTSSGWSADIGLGGSIVAAYPLFFCIVCRTAGDQITVNTGGSAYAVTPTAGFGNW